MVINTLLVNWERKKKDRVKSGRGERERIKREGKKGKRKMRDKRREKEKRVQFMTKQCKQINDNSS